MELNVNDVTHMIASPPLTPLLKVLREELHVLSPKAGCEQGACGTCTVLVDGRAVSSCCFLAADADGCEVLTIEGLAALPEFERLEQAFTSHSALQCGFCTSGMLLTVSSLLATGELTSEEEIKRSLNGNLCRCTGYRGIVEAVVDLAGVE